MFKAVQRITKQHMFKAVQRITKQHMFKAVQMITKQHMFKAVQRITQQHMFKAGRNCVHMRHTQCDTHTSQYVQAPRSMCRVGQNRIYTPYMTVCMVISLPEILYVHCIYV